MQVIQRETSIPANSVNDNVFAGSAFEFAKGSSLVSIGSVAAATGLQITIQSGGQSIMEESPPLIKAAFPSTEDDMYYNFGAIAGDRLVLRARNTTGAAIILRTLAQIQPAR
jgi:hypothetical protein